MEKLSQVNGKWAGSPEREDISRKWWVGLLLFLLFFFSYFSISRLLRNAGAFDEFDVLFEMDTPRVITDMTVFREDHSRTRVHPLYVLAINPIGARLAAAMGDRTLAAQIINSALGAAGVVMAFFFFLHAHRKMLDAALLAILFGVTASQSLIATIPDTASLAVVSLIVTYTLFVNSLRERRARFFPWVLAGLFTLGVTTTNFAQTAILYFIAACYADHRRGGLKAWFEPVLFVMSVFALAVALALVQKAIYPSSTLFFMPSSFTGELQYAGSLIFNQTRRVLVYVIKNFFLINVAAPAPHFLTIPGLTQPAVTFAASNDYSLIGWSAVILWAGLVVSFLLKVFKEKKYWVFIAGMAACMVINLLLHSFYGVTENRIELFLYTGNFTFLLLTPLAIPSQPTEEKSLRAVLILLIALLALNHYYVIQAIVRTLVAW